ncbi:MAG: phosphoribosyl-ATP diphosphatase [Rhodospirillaceae bacterium]|nr:phosphoribosyl-ATP diphosphatase [Rhodospirillaceae bacterium]MCK5167555.1 phosphoribosyl-ATP diphosphatase [Rhodospirillaceae bacterium]
MNKGKAEKRASGNVEVVERLFDVIESRRGNDPETSHTARLFSRGRGKICQKLGEEAVEVVVAALDQKPKHVARESADLLYHLLVLWAEVGLSPAQVWAELEAREGISGIEEKNSRR